MTGGIDQFECTRLGAARLRRVFARLRGGDGRVRRLVATALVATVAAHWPGADAAAQSTGFRGGPDRAGTYPAPPAAERGIVLWRVATAGPVRSSPVIDGDALLVGSGDGAVRALDLTTGETLWRTDVGSPVHSTPAVADGRVLFTDLENRVHALDRATGEPLWTTPTGPDHPWAWGHEGWDYFTSSPAVVDGVVYVGSGDGAVYALDAGTGEVRWSHATGGRVRASPAVVDGVVYAGSADGVIYALRASDGEVVWSFETDGTRLSSAEAGFDRRTVQGSTAVVDGVVHVGSRDGRTYALDAGTGRLVWKTPDATAWFIGSPAVGPERLFNGSSDGLYVHALDRDTGEEAWRTDVGARVFGSPALAGDAVYVGSHAGRFTKLSVADGSLEWELRVGAGIMSSPAVRDGVVYFGADDGVVRAVALEAGPPPRRAVYWDSTRVDRNTLYDHERVRDHLRSRGYGVLDAAGVADFMTSALADGAPSVVVFALDDVPPTLAEAPERPGLLGRYLEAGGKVVWLGLPPFYLTRDDAGRPAGIDREAPASFLGVNHGGYELDRQAVRPTEAGRRWGLDGWWVAGSGVAAAQVEPLAVDERGGASAWVRDYGGPPGTGFVFLWGHFLPMEPGFVEQILEVAEYGVGRRAR